MAGTVVFLGAGATKSCGGPLTSEILPQIYAKRTKRAVKHETLLEEFLAEQFHVTPESPSDLYPGLPLVMSLVDTALDRRQDFHPSWDSSRLASLRQHVEFAIFDLLEENLKVAPTNNHWTLLNRLFPDGTEPCVISTNYDLIIDATLMFLGGSRGKDGRLPNYCCQIQTPFYREGSHRFGTLLKLHGSLNWLYCKTCQRLEIGASESKKYLTVLRRMVGPTCEQMYSADGAPCPACKTRLRPLLVAPTHMKDYRNPHLAQVWHQAERVLREADRAVFVGYSLPEDDVEVIYLLKRALAHLDASKITVVDHAEQKTGLKQHAAGRRYRALFGDNLDWHWEGLDKWLASLAGAPAAKTKRRRARSAS